MCAVMGTPIENQKNAKATDIWFVGTHPSLEPFLKSRGDSEIKKFSSGAAPGHK